MPSISWGALNNSGTRKGKKKYVRHLRKDLLPELSITHPYPLDPPLSHLHFLSAALSALQPGGSSRLKDGVSGAYWDLIYFLWPFSQQPSTSDWQDVIDKILSSLEFWLGLFILSLKGPQWHWPSCPQWSFAQLRHSLDILSFPVVLLLSSQKRAHTHTHTHTHTLLLIGNDKFWKVRGEERPALI